MGNVSSYEYIQQITENIIPSMAYHENANFEEWKKSAREKLIELLGLPLIRCDTDFAIIKEEDCERYKKIAFQYQSEPGYYVPCTLLVPKRQKKPTAGVICLQGHSTGAHISVGICKFPNDDKSIAGGRDFAVRAVEEGYCAIALEQRYMGVKGQDDRGNPSCIAENTAMAGLLIGRTALGERVWDIQCLIDVIEKHLMQYIDAKQIICMGNSGGGTATFYASCIDERISLSIPSCGVCTYEESIMAMYHCPCNFVPGIRKYFNMGDLGCLIAPRPVIVTCGKEDPIFPLPGVEKSFAIMQRAYHNVGKSDLCYLVKGDGGHQFFPDDVWPIVHRIKND